MLSFFFSGGPSALCFAGISTAAEKERKAESRKRSFYKDAIPNGID
jgi:hypothetical protein